MCDIQDINKGEKRITITLKNGLKFVSQWFTDDNGDKALNNVTSKEDEVLKELIKIHNIAEEDIEEWFISRRREPGTLYISDHAMSRLKERNGWNKKTAMRMIPKIYDEGVNAKDVKGYLRPWAENKEAKKNPGEEYLLYGTNMYVFSHKTLLTVIPVPKKGKHLSK